MTSEYDELLARLDARKQFGDEQVDQAAAAIRALTAQVVERDAVIESLKADLEIAEATSTSHSILWKSAEAELVEREVVSEQAPGTMDEPVYIRVPIDGWQVFVCSICACLTARIDEHNAWHMKGVDHEG